MRRIWLLAALALLSGACGGGNESSQAKGGGAERTVLVDYEHDEFASAFLRYYPETVKVRPGDTVRFEQAWTGEPHSVTMGKVVDNLFEYGELFEKYDSPEDALAGGETQETIDKVNATFAKLPGMLGEGNEVFQAGAQPCFVPDFDAVPNFGDGTGKVLEGVECPTAGAPQPAFNGRHGLYNSGFIPPEGESANTFLVPIAADTEPGTYKYFCNYHWTEMSGNVELVAANAKVPSQTEVAREARKEIEEDAKAALQRVREAKKAKGAIGDLDLPLAGREVAEDDYTVIINEFLPAKVTAKVGKPVKWTFDGAAHTVSFNVPKYFPIFTVKPDRTVEWNPKSYEPVGWTVPPPPEGSEGGNSGQKPEPRNIEVGDWDGKGGFHSSGSLDAGDTFSVTFTKPGTYPFACVLHPQMVGTLVVKS